MKPLLFLCTLGALALNADAAELKTFQVRGVVKEVHPEKREVVVRHDEIAGYMAAMTMPFIVRDPQLLAPIKPGDRVTFRLSVSDKEDWIDQLKIVGSGIAKESQLPLSAPKLDALKPGEPLPDLNFIDEGGRPLRLADFRGKAFAFTFIYTRCPLPRFCPLLAQKFRATQTALAADARAPKNWQLLCLTIDPARDTPEVLRRYAESLEADPAHWHFATGDLRDITILALRCGVNFWDEDGAIVHNVRTVVVDPAGRVRRLIAENEWTPEELARELREAASVKK